MVTGEDDVYYHLDGDRVVEMKKGNIRYVFTYDTNGNPYSVTYYASVTATAGATYYYILNLQGDVVQIINNENSVLANYRYDAWGKLLAVTDKNGNAITDKKHIGNVNPIRYRGYFYDTETGLYYCNSRYYDPQMKRFINADGTVSTGQGFVGYNMFAYCGNNPVMYSDPSGYCRIIKPLVQFVKNLERAIGIAASIAGYIDTSLQNPDGTYHNTYELYEYSAIIYAEVGGENDITVRAAAHSVMNRLGATNISDKNVMSISAIVNDPAQYNAKKITKFDAAMSYYTSGYVPTKYSDYNNEIEMQEMRRIRMLVAPIYNGYEPDFTGGVHSFHNHPNPWDWEYHYAHTQVYIPGANPGIYWYKD